MSIDRFLSWFQSTNVNTEYVNVQYSDHSAFGLYSRQLLIEKDFLVLSIPEDLFIKPLFEKKDWTGFEYLIEYLLNNQTNPYVEFLRSISSIPLWCAFVNEKYPRQLIKQMKKHLNKYNQSREKFLQYNDDQFQWVYYTINTRCVHFDMEIDSKDQDNNLCLIPYLDFVNHSIEPNTISKFNPLTRSYEIRTIKSIDFNEQITFLYNPHSNVDLFIEYGFVLSANPSNLINIEYELEQLLTKEQIQILQSYNYWNALEFYSGDHDLSWTIIKAIEIHFHQLNWSPYDDPSPQHQQEITKNIKLFLHTLQQNIEQDFQQWTTDHFIVQKTTLFSDFSTVIHDTSLVIDKYIQNSYIFFPHSDYSRLRSSYNHDSSSRLALYEKKKKLSSLLNTFNDCYNLLPPYLNR